MKGELTITVPFELEKHDYVNKMWPPPASTPGEASQEEVDSYMLSTIINKVLSKLGTQDIPLIYSSGYFHGDIYLSKAALIPQIIP